MNREDIICFLSQPTQPSEAQKPSANKALLRLAANHNDSRSLSGFILSEAVRLCINPSYLLGVDDDSIVSTVNNLIKLSLCDLFNNNDDHDLVFKLISEHGLSPFKALSLEDVSRENTANHARWSNGSLKNPKAYKRWLESKFMIMYLVGSVLIADDYEGLRHLLSISRVSEAVGKNIHEIFNFLKIEDGECFKIFNKESSSVTPLSDYIKHITSLAVSGFFHKVNKEYRLELSAQCGHEILFAISSKEKQSKTLAMLTALLTKDGADWYLSFMQMTCGPSAYIDLASREKKPSEELVHVLSTLTENKNKKENKFITNIVLGLPRELVLEVARLSQGDADKLFSINNDQALLPYVSNLAKRRSLDQDFSL